MLAVSRNFSNQFETPVLMLFLVAVSNALHVNDATSGLAAIAWAWVTFRILHSIIHCTSNHVLARLAAFAASTACIGLYAWRLMKALP